LSNDFSMHLKCTHCGEAVDIPFEPSMPLPWISCCPKCGKQFGIESESIAHQIKLFTDLCHQIKASEEILSSASIAVSVGSTEVKVPFKLLLTRLKSTLDLEIDGQKLCISKRAEFLKTTPTQS